MIPAPSGNTGGADDGRLRLRDEVIAGVLQVAVSPAIRKVRLALEQQPQPQAAAVREGTLSTTVHVAEQERAAARRARNARERELFGRRLTNAERQDLLRRAMRKNAAEKWLRLAHTVFVGDGSPPAD